MTKTEHDFYLSHPVDSRRLIRGWELTFEKKTGLVLFNPFYDHTREEIAILDSGVNYHIYNKTLDPETIVLNDLANIKKSRLGTIVILPEIDLHSYGTIMEMVYSKIMDKKTYSLIINGYHNHPLLRFHSTEIFTDFNSLENRLWTLRK